MQAAAYREQDGSKRQTGPSTAKISFDSVNW
jgi:hypothetical protein